MRVMKTHSANVGAKSVSATSFSRYNLACHGM
jgi:hypothetical protein